MHGDIQEVCGSSRIVTALVLKFTGAQRAKIVLLLFDEKHLSAVDKSAFTDIFSVRLHCHITAQYRHVVEYSDL